jgi:hypothetical protein
MIKETPIDFEVVSKHIRQSGLKSVGKASIREIKRLIDNIQAEPGKEYIRMEMGIPGLPAANIGVEAEKAALATGVAAIYPDVHGVPVLKQEISRFVKNFLDLDVARMPASRQWGPCKAALQLFSPSTGCTARGKAPFSSIPVFLSISNNYVSWDRVSMPLMFMITVEKS